MDRGKNLGTRRKSRVAAKISGRGENRVTRRKSREAAKISRRGENFVWKVLRESINFQFLAFPIHAETIGIGIGIGIVSSQFILLRGWDEPPPR